MMGPLRPRHKRLIHSAASTRYDSAASNPSAPGPADPFRSVSPASRALRFLAPNPIEPPIRHAQFRDALLVATTNILIFRSSLMVPEGFLHIGNQF